MSVSIFEVVTGKIYQFASESFGQAVGEGSQESGAGVKVFERVVDDELIDWANRVDIPIPDWATKVEVLIEDSAPQTGAANTLYINANDDNGANYDILINTFKSTGLTPSAFTGLTRLNIARLLPSTDGNLCEVAFTPKNRGCKRRFNIQTQYVDSVEEYNQKNGIWKNLVDDITSIQFHTSASTNVSCAITVRAWS